MYKPKKYMVVGKTKGVFYSTLEGYTNWAIIAGLYAAVMIPRYDKVEILKTDKRG